MLTKFKNRDEWLNARRTMITASDVAAILGWDERRTALDVYVQKKTGLDIRDNDAMLLGRCMEDGEARVYAEKTLRKVVDPNPCIAVHGLIPWLAATPDRLVWGDVDEDDIMPWETGNPLELKLAGWMKRRDWEDDCPLWVNIQLQIQMACMGSDWGAYCGVVGGSEIHYGDVDFNDGFFQSSLPVLDEFKWRLNNEKPPAVESARHLKAIKLLHPDDNGETVELSDKIRLLADQLEDFKGLKKSNESQIECIEAQIREAIGNATFGSLPDGTILSLKTTNRKGFTSVVAPTTYRTLRRLR